jgi:hypothetical protein
MHTFRAARHSVPRVFKRYRSFDLRRFVGYFGPVTRDGRLLLYTPSANFTPHGLPNSRQAASHHIPSPRRRIAFKRAPPVVSVNPLFTPLADDGPCFPASATLCHRYNGTRRSTPSGYNHNNNIIITDGQSGASEDAGLALFASAKDVRSSPNASLLFFFTSLLLQSEHGSAGQFPPAVHPLRQLRVHHTY